MHKSSPESQSHATGLFVTGTDTGVGKTFVAAMIVRALFEAGTIAGVYKPVCSGAVETPDGLRWDDVDVLHAAAGGRFERDRICPQRFRAPLAPPVAASLEQTQVGADLLIAGADWWRDRCEVLIVEGVGGLLCPLTESTTVADLAVQIGFPLLIVARATLGTINHTLLTIEAARRRGLTVAGVVLNEVAPAVDDASIATNVAEIARFSGATVLGIVPHGHPARLLPSPPSRKIDWRSLAGR